MKNYRVVKLNNGQYKIQERFLFLFWIDDDDYFFDKKTYKDREKALRIAILKYAAQSIEILTRPSHKS